jgi:hypothetical protein
MSLLVLLVVFANCMNIISIRRINAGRSRSIVFLIQEVSFIDCCRRCLFKIIQIVGIVSIR